jgi:hypothetical protein
MIASRKQHSLRFNFETTSCIWSLESIFWYWHWAFIVGISLQGAAVFSLFLVSIQLAIDCPDTQFEFNDIVGSPTWFLPRKWHRLVNTAFLPDDYAFGSVTYPLDIV